MAVKLNVVFLFSSNNKKLIKNNASNTKPVNRISVKPDKVYLRKAEGDFKKHYHNRMRSFCNKLYTNDTSLSKYIWEIKEKHQENPSMKWLIVKRVPVSCILQHYKIVSFMPT